MNTRQLMDAHCSALFVQNNATDLVRINDWLKRDAPLFWIGFTSEGMIWRFHKRVAATARRQVEVLISQETYGREKPLPDHHTAYCKLFDNQQATAGPTYWLANSPVEPAHEVMRVSAANADTLSYAGLDDWKPDIPHQQPMFVSIDDHHAAAVCASVRKSVQAHEVGVETASRYRRRGHAASAVSAWASQLIRNDIIPLYSTSWENLASQAVARHVGFERYGWEYSIG